MLCDTTKTVHVPLSRCTTTEIHEKAVEFRRRAATASATSGDRQALIALAGRYTALAKRREADEQRAHKAADGLALRVAEANRTDERTATSGPGLPMGLPSPQALQMATDAIGRHFVLPETRQHPVIKSAAMELAYLLMAYGLVPSEPAAQPGMTEKPCAAEGLGGSSHTSHHILVVDDAPDMLVTVGAFLVGAGFAVRKTNDGDEALQMIASDPNIDILITDFAMPGLNGVELIAQAAKIRPHLKALVITGYPNADELAALPPQATVLAKPFRRDALIAWVKSALADIRPVPGETMESVDQAR